MSDKKTVLIITDGTESIDLLARSIADNLKNYQVKITSAEKFEGTDLLPADIFFIGCEKPNHPSFSYLEKMLAHINLAARKCALFSTNKETIKYLESLVKDSDASYYEPLIGSCGHCVNEWFKEVKL